MSNAPTIKTTQTIKSTAVESKKVIYIGASLNNGRLHQYSVFNNGIPEFLKEDIEKCPAIKTLMIPVSELGVARPKLTQLGTVEHTLNEEILKYVRSEQ